MLPSGKYQVARPGQPSRQMTLSEINLGLASGEVMPEDQYWAKGMSGWERVSALNGVVIPSSPRTRVSPDAPPGSRLPSGNTNHALPARGPAASAAPGSLSYWAQPDTKPRLAVWSPVAYTLLSVFFTPLVGTILIAQNHRATEETVWRGISWFWMVAWSGFLLVGLALYFAKVACGSPLYWGLGACALIVTWFFTCALPHREFLHARSFDAAWRTDWGKPVGFGFLAWVLVFTTFLLTR